MKYPRRLANHGFTLIELMIVILIMLTLIALFVGAAKGVQDKGRKSRAQAEIQALSTAIEDYKVDNNYYPAVAVGLNGSNTSIDATGIVAPTSYPNPKLLGTLDYTTFLSANEALYQDLSGVYSPNNTATFPQNPPTGKVYMEFHSNQLRVDSNKFVIIKDPWDLSSSDPYGKPYGYSYSTSTATSYNTNFYDLWSTGGLAENTTITAPLQSAFISNWPH